MKNETFVKDAETGCLVGDLGTIIGVRGGVRKLKTDRYGYLICGCYISAIRKMKWIPVHRLVARNYIMNPLGLPCINHKDENKKNNSVSNLEWCTIKHNNTYGTRIEKVKSTLKNGGIERMLETNLRKNNKKKEHAIMLQYKEAEVIKTFKSYSAAARELDVYHTSICAIANGKTYSIKGWHLPNVKRKNIKEIALEKNGEVKKFNSLHEAAIALKVSDSLIGKVYQGVNKTCAGWKLFRPKDSTNEICSNKTM